MFCPNCGSKVNDDARFCLNCGHQFQSINNNKIKYISSALTTELKNSISFNGDNICLLKQKSLLYIIKTKLQQSNIDRNMIQIIKFNDNIFMTLIKIVVSLFIIPCIISIGIMPVFNFIYNLVLGASHRYLWDPNMLDVWNESVFNQGIQISIWSFVSLILIYVLLNLYFNIFLNNTIKIITNDNKYKIKINIFNRNKYDEIKKQIIK